MISLAICVTVVSKMTSASERTLVRISLNASFAWFHFVICAAVLEEISDFFAVSQSLQCAVAVKEPTKPLFFFFFFFLARMYLAKKTLKFNKFGPDALVGIRVPFH